MKKVILIFVCVLATQFASAQNEAFKKDVMQLLEISGAGAQMDVAKEQLIKMIPVDKQAAFIVEFTATFPAFYEKLAAVYMEVYTQQDVKDMIKFYESPVGKKMSSKAGELLKSLKPQVRNGGNHYNPC